MNYNILLIAGIGFLAIAVFLIVNPLMSEPAIPDIDNEQKIENQEAHFESKGMNFKEDMIFKGLPETKRCEEVCFQNQTLNGNITKCEIICI
jgi:hypothetical protein